MGLPQLETCCMVTDLKTGNLILGSLNAFLSFMMTVMMVVTAAGLSSLSNSAMESPDKNPKLQAASTAGYLMVVILALIFLSKFCFDVMFIYGVVKEKPGYIKAYMIMWAVLFFILFFGFISNTANYHFSIIGTFFVYISLNIYVILLCNSFYKTINCRETI